MKQIAIIGLGSFGIRMLEELKHYEAEVLILDKNNLKVDKYKDDVRDAFVADAINEEVLKKIIPQDVDAVIVDVGDKIEVSIMITNYLHKMGVKNIIPKAESDEHGEILKLVGASQIVFPDMEAAKRITPQLVSSELFNYLQISTNFVLAEIKTAANFVGKTLAEADIRRLYGLNIVAYRSGEGEEFRFIPGADFRFTENQLLLVAGTAEALDAFVEHDKPLHHKKTPLFSRLFPQLPGIPAIFPDK